MENLPIISRKKLRKTIEVTLPDGRIFSGPRGTCLEAFMKVLPEWDNPQIVGAVVNGDLRELTYPLMMDAKVTPLAMNSADGARIYRRSLTFLLVAAFDGLFPNFKLTVDHSVSSGGYFCQVSGREQLTFKELEQLDAHMHTLVSENLPFIRKVVPLTEAVEYFEKNGYTDKVRLLKYRQKDNLVLYSLKEHRDYFHGYMVPSTGYLHWFGLTWIKGGFILRYPRRHAPDELLPMPDYSKLLKTFTQYGAWLQRLGIENVGQLNDGLHGEHQQEIILVSEALHEQKIAEIARKIVDRSKTARIVLIAGPSSSGKTTFSKRLAIQLLAYGISPFALELDNYFVSREETPLDENGEYDFESLQALDIGLLEENLTNLAGGREVQLPHFDFRKGRSSPGEVVKLSADELIILEGIHGLNPNLLPHVPEENTFRIYISCLTQLNLDRHNRISTTDTRLIRRIVRDARERGYSAADTIGRWESVRRGEKRNIFPYQENADEMFNSALAYELSALKPLAEPLLRQVAHGSQEYIEAKRLLAFLEWFQPVTMDNIPDNSILREFTGGSILRDFKLWDRPQINNF